MYTHMQFLKDKMFILKLNEKLGFNNIGDLFYVNSNGNNILIDLMAEGKVSPIFYIMMYKKGVKQCITSKYKTSALYNRVNKITKAIVKQGERK